MSDIIKNPDAPVHTQQYKEIREEVVPVPPPLKAIRLGFWFIGEVGYCSVLGRGMVKVKLSGEEKRLTPDECEAVADALVKLAARQREVENA